MPERYRALRILLLADTHLGFDLPSRPRVKRRRRGHDFQANHERALEPAKAGAVDLVVHGGDLFHRSRVPASLVFQAFRSLLEIAESGIPVFVVPGNHERSRIPHVHLASHPNLHVFHRSDTRVVTSRGLRVGVSGFPYQRRGIRKRFPEILEETGWREESTDLRLLCVHHCVEGATVGPADFTFRNGPDVIRCSDLPGEFAAVLSGHIHRHQVLATDLEGHPLSAPVFYPGSVERAAFAEMGEGKGFMVLEVAPGKRGGTVTRHEFIRLPARPMLSEDLHPDAGSATAWTEKQLLARVERVLATAPSDAVFRILVHGHVSLPVRQALSAPRLRAICPREMNLEIVIAEDRINGRPGRRVSVGKDSGPKTAGGEGLPPPQLRLDLPLTPGP